MARSRNIKPGFFTNDVLGELPALTRLLFAGLWTIADREGRIEDRPKKIRAEILPYDQCDADEMLQALDSYGFIKRYEQDGIKVIQVLAWKLHQNPHVKEAPSTLPAFAEHHASTIQEQCKEQPLPERAGLIPSLLIPDSLISDSSGESSPTAAPRFVLPDWIPADTWAAYLKVRSAKKAKNEPHALGLIIKDLEKFKASGHDPTEVLNNSIKSGWAGVFEPKVRQNGLQVVQSVTVPSKPGIDPTLSRIIAEQMSGAVKPPSADIRAKLAQLSSGARA